MTKMPDCGPLAFKPGVWPSTKDRTREFLAELVRLIDAGGVRIDICTLDNRGNDFTLNVRGGRK